MVHSVCSCPLELEVSENSETLFGSTVGAFLASGRDNVAASVATVGWT